MTASRHVSATPATDALRRAGIAFGEHTYDYVEHGGTGAAAARLGIDEHRIIKTLVLQDQDRRPLVVLMHGDRSVSTRQLGRAIGAKSVEPCSPEQAQRATGYRVGGISPFGTKKRMPVFVERGILSLPTILINGGRRGYLIEIAPQVVVDLLGAVPVDCAIASA